MVRVDGDIPEPAAMPEKFRNERKVRLAVRTALASIVRPLSGMLEVSLAFAVVEEELAYLREWFEAQIERQKQQKEKS